VPGDIVKVVIATIVTLALWRAYPRAFDRGARTTVDIRVAPHGPVSQTERAAASE